MEELRARLNRHRIIGLDSSPFIYHFESHPRYLPLTMCLFTGLQEGRWRGVTSVITLMEITVRPWQLGHEEAARDYETLLTHFPNLYLAQINRDIAREAAILRARYGINPPDALQVAAAISYLATAFITNDLSLRCLKPEIDILCLDEFLKASKPV